MCSNCGRTNGPFYRAWKERGEIVVRTPPLCKNTKENQNRITECVEIRSNADAKKYQEQLHGYA